jgi:hypothetical protein
MMGWIWKGSELPRKRSGCPFGVGCEFEAWRRVIESMMSHPLEENYGPEV